MNRQQEAAKCRRFAKRSRVAATVFTILGVMFVGAAGWLMTQGDWTQAFTTLTSTVIIFGSVWLMRESAKSLDRTAERWESRR